MWLGLRVAQRNPTESRLLLHCNTGFLLGFLFFVFFPTDCFSASSLHSCHDHNVCKIQFSPYRTLPHVVHLILMGAL